MYFKISRIKLFVIIVVVVIIVRPTVFILSRYTDHKVWIFTLLKDLVTVFRSAHQVDADSFMTRDIHFLTLKSTYNHVLELLHLHSVRSYPLVDNAGKPYDECSTTVYYYIKAMGMRQMLGNGLFHLKLNYSVAYW